MITKTSIEQYASQQEPFIQECFTALSTNNDKYAVSFVKDSIQDAIRKCMEYAEADIPITRNWLSLICERFVIADLIDVLQVSSRRYKKTLDYKMTVCWGLLLKPMFGAMLSDILGLRLGGLNEQQEAGLTQSLWLACLYLNCPD